MNDFVPKPVNPDALYAVLLKWLKLSEGNPRAISPPPPPATPEFATGATRAENSTVWVRQLAGIPGLDVERGLSLVRGSSTKYARMLALFADSHAQDMVRLSERMAAQDLIAVTKLAHALKGSTGMIGATRVSEAAFALQSVILCNPAGNEIDVCCNRLIAELAPLIDGILGLDCFEVGVATLSRGDPPRKPAPRPVA